MKNYIPNHLHQSVDNIAGQQKNSLSFATQMRECFSTSPNLRVCQMKTIKLMMTMIIKLVGVRNHWLSHKLTHKQHFVPYSMK